MAPPKFPTAEAREQLMQELLAAEQNGTGQKTGEHYLAYCQAFRELNGLMDQYAREEPPYGIPRTLDAAGKEALMSAIAKTAALGEAFLADVQRKRPEADLSKSRGVPGTVHRLQALLSGDFEMLSAYKPEEAKLSFPELQEDARTRIVDFRGMELKRLGASQSSRLAMTVVDATGRRRRGVFTKASYMDSKSKFHGLLDRLKNYYDSPEFAAQLPAYKKEMFNSGTQPSFIHSAEEILDEVVQNRMKGRVDSFLERYRGYLKQKGYRIENVVLEEATEEQLLGHLATAIREFGGGRETLKRLGVSPEELGEKVYQGLVQGLDEYSQDVSHTMNGMFLGLKEGDRLDHRNSAMSAVAALLGVPELVARSENMKYLDENGNVAEGTFTEFSPGMDLFSRQGGQCMTHIGYEPFKPPSGLVKSLADLQVLDYICGNVDRHSGNLTFFTDKNGVFTGVQAIDNDSSFGVSRPGRDKEYNRLHGTGDLQVVSQSMAEKIRHMTPDMLRFALRGRGLKPEELQAACDRLTDLQTALRKENCIEASGAADLKWAGNKLCVMSDERLKRLPFSTLAEKEYTLFHDLKTRFEKRVLIDRERYPFNPNARRGEQKPLTEVSTTDRVHAAGGIAASMQSMSRAIRNKVTGFQVGDLSSFLRSSGKFRDMVSAVKDAKTTAKQVREAIGKDKERLDRADPLVREQLERANRAMTKVRTATEAYLQKKMTERGVQSREALKTAGKNAYEQKRINYALKLMGEVEAYEAVNEPKTEQAKQEKELVSERNRLAIQREAQDQPGLNR